MSYVVHKGTFQVTSVSWEASSDVQHSRTIAKRLWPEHGVGEVWQLGKISDPVGEGEHSSFLARPASQKSYSVNGLIYNKITFHEEIIL